MLSMFKEKDCNGAGTTCWSMTRVVAFVSALTLNGVLIVMAMQNHVHDIAWPFCVMFVAVLFAVPLQALFKYIQSVWNNSMSQKITRILVEKISGAALSTPTTTTKVETTTGGDATGA